MFTATASAVRSLFAVPFLTGVFCCLTAVGIKAQTPAAAKGSQVRVTGRVVEEGSAKPVKSASVYMKNLADGSATGDLADADGKFSVNNAKPGRYHIAVSYLGFAKHKDTIVIEASKPVLDLGIISLAPAASKVGEVSVTGERETMEITPEKKVFNVEKNATVTGGTAADVLRQVPTVDVDVNGNISVRGSSNLVIQINGKQTGFAGSDRAALLQQLPANLIEKVEVITNPSARYDAEGMAGIINIVTKADISQSWNLSLMGGAGTNHKYNASADFGYKNGPLSLSAGYGGRIHNQFFGASLDVAYLTSTKEKFGQRVDGTWSGMGHFGNFNADYAVNENITLNLTGQARFNDGKNNEIIGSNYMLTSGESYRRTTRTNAKLNGWQSGEIGGGYKQLFTGKQHYLDISTRYSANRNTSKGNLSEQDNDLDGNPLQTLPSVQNNNFINDFRIWTVQADYVQPISIGKLETGVKSTLRMIENEAYLDSLNRTSGEFIPNTFANNRFAFSDHVLAGYGMLSTKLLSFNVQAGLRVEHTFVNTHQITTGDKSAMNYTHLFPTLHVSYKLDTINTLQLSYSRRINRPQWWQLNPSVDYSNPTLLRKGNPTLMPETIDAAEMSFVTQIDKHTVTATGYYRRTNNAMQFYADVDPNLPPSAGNTVLTFRNFDVIQNTGFEFVYRGQIFPWWTATANVNLFYNSIQGGSEVGNISAGTVTYNVRAMSSFKMPWEGGNLQANYMYNGPMVMSQGTMDAWHALTLGFRQDLSREFSVTLNVSDVLNTQRFFLRLADTAFTTTVDQKPETRIATLNISYRIGAMQADQQRRRPSDGGGGDGGQGGGFGF